MSFDFNSLLAPSKPEIKQQAKEPNEPLKPTAPKVDFSKLTVAERLRVREEQRLAAEHKAKLQAEDDALGADPEPTKPLATFSLDIKLNQKQLMAGEYAKAGKCFVLTGAAGTGKTTAAREIAKQLLEHGVLGTHNFYVGDGQYQTGPSVAFCAYTNRATDNIRRALHKDPHLEEKLTHNVVTLHKLLEFYPEFYYDAEAQKDKMRFVPRRNASNKLGITHLIIEESSMVGTAPLWQQVFDALPEGAVVIFLGDINQLQPVAGASVLNYALVQLPVVELTEVYRQALESPILSNAHRVLKGQKLQPDGNYFKLIQSKPGSKMMSEAGVSGLLVNSLKKWHETGEYNPDTDIVLSPFNKAKFACGTKVLNAHIAQFLGDKRNAKVHQVLAGRNVNYLAEGDKVLIDKMDGVITKINLNASYMGKSPKSITHDINRFGLPTLNGHSSVDIDDDDFELVGYEELNVDEIPEEEKKAAASHVVHVQLTDGGEVTLDRAGDFSDVSFSLGYALSVHKAQGSEWRKVILVLHRNFATLSSRELLYTAITRAREYCTIVDVTNCIDRIIASQRIKGNSLEEKIEYFNSKVALNDVVPIIP